MNAGTACLSDPPPADIPRRAQSLVASRHDGLRGERIMEVCEGMIDICAALFNVPSKEMRQTGRASAAVSRVRQVAMYVTHVSLGIAMHEVGRGFARDRTTVGHACHLIEDLRDDPEFDRIMAIAERVASAAFRARLEG